MYFVYIVKFSSLTGLIKRRDEKGGERGSGAFRRSYIDKTLLG